MPDTTPDITIADPVWTAQPSVTAGLWLVVESGVTPGGVPYCGRVVAECSGPDAERNARIMAGAPQVREMRDRFAALLEQHYSDRARPVHADGRVGLNASKGE